MTVDFGFIPEFSIGSNVFVDNNDNGIRDPEDEGIEGVLVEVFNTGADGIAENADDQLVGSDVTDANGDYFVGWLRPGDFYAVIAEPSEEFPRSSGPTNLTPDEDLDNDDNGIQDAPGDGVWSNVITLSANDEPTDEPGSGGDQDDALDDDNGNMTLDFGFTPELSIGSTVFVDNNDNGIQDPDDEGIEGVTIEVFSVGPDGIPENGDDVLVGTDVTDANGDYFVDGLAPGDYYVAIPTPSEDFPISSTGFGANPNDDVDEDDNGIQDAPGEGVWSNVITLLGGTEPTDEPGSGGDQDAADDDNGNMTVDFGFIPELSVGSTVFADNNDNGIQDPEDDGIEGVTVEVFSVGPDGIPENADDVLVGTDVTDANGDYFVGGLAPGDYYVAIPNVDEDFPISSTGFGANPNDDVDNDDNGIQDAPGDGVWSNVITLIGGTEPTGADESGSGGDQDDDDDANGNMTVDFGFIPSVDISLIKLVSNATPTIGDIVTFSIEVSNDGPNDATGIAVEDVVPNGFTGITAVSNGGSVDGSTITWTGIDVAVGASVVLTFDVEVLAPTEGVDFNNIAEVTALDQNDIDSEEDNGADTDGDGLIGSEDSNPNDPGIDPDDEDDADDEPVAVDVNYDLALIKIVDPEGLQGPFNVGDIVI